MTAADWPRADPDAQRLLHVDPSSGRVEDRRLQDLPWLLRSGDLLVVNDAATLPASLAAVTESGEPLELRLAGACGDGLSWRAVLFGRGDWRQATEARRAPPRLDPGARVRFAADFAAEIVGVSPVSPRLVEIRFQPGPEEERFWRALYAHGRPVQYSYLRAPLALAQVQTRYAARPWAVEPPSAGHPLRLGLLGRVLRAGVDLAALTHAAGLSSTGDAALDALLPLPERYEVPPATARAVERARARQGRVVAVGTSVVRALEASAARGGRVVAGAGVAELRVGPGFRPRVVNGLLTGVHEPGSSHHALLGAFVGADVLARAARRAERNGYLIHEFGDSWLVLAA